VAGHQLAFEHDLGVGGNGEASVRTKDDVDRRAPQAAREIVLGDASWQRAGGQEVQQRILSADDGDLHALAALEVGVAVDAAVLTLGDLAAHRLPVVHLRSVRPEVDPVAIGVLGDHQVRGPDVARRVPLVVQRHGKLQHVDGVARQNVLEDRPIAHDARLEHRHALHALVVGLHEIRAPLILQRQPERQRDSPDCGEVPVERAVPGRVTGNVVEKDRGSLVAAALREHLGERAHLAVPVGPVHGEQLAETIDLFEPAP